MGINKVILVGNAGKDPETRHLENGTPVCNFSLATSETYKDKAGQKVTTTEWHNIVLWRGLAEVAEKYVKKGSQLYIEGKIKTRSYEDKDGVKRYSTEIVADTMQLLGKAGDGGSSHEGSTSSNQTSSTSSTSNTSSNTTSVDDFDIPDLPADGDDLPF